jgi:hypothetical protein
MKERLQHHLSDVGESFDYLRSDVRNLSRYMAELEELVEHYRTFAANATLSTPTDRAEIRKLLKKTHKVLGPPPDEQPARGRLANDQRAERLALFEGPRHTSTNRRIVSHDEVGPGEMLLAH